MRSLRKTVPFVTLLFMAGIVAVGGCSPVKTPAPTPDIAATVEAVVAATMASQPTPDLAVTTVEAAVVTKTPVPTPDMVATIEAAVAATMASQPTPDLAATVEAAVATKMAATQTDQAEPACVSPTIEFTHVPPYGNDYEDLKGRVACVEPADYKVAVYICVDGGCYNKPFLASPLTTIGSDGAWTTDITLAPNDPRATQIAAFLVRNGYSPPLMGGETMFPEELYKSSVDCAMADREPDARIIDFSGHT